MDEIPNSGKFLIIGFQGTSLDKDLSELIEHFPPAGFLLLSHNFESLEQLTNLTAELRSACGDDIIIAVDQEPGRVQRFKSEFPKSLLPEAYVKGKQREFRNWCAQTAGLLHESGVNMNFAPVLDLTSFRGNSQVLTGRTFGDQTALVEEFGRILIEEHHKAKVLTCGKHFPGLGSAANDPHEKLSISFDTAGRFEQFHWVPFRSAIQNGVDSIMTTHLKAPALDPEFPATYSTLVLAKLKALTGNTRLIISDDMIMKGAGDNISVPENTVRALAAGHHLAIISRNPDIQFRTAEEIQKKIETDRDFRDTMIAGGELIDIFKSKASEK